MTHVDYMRSHGRERRTIAPHVFVSWRDCARRHACRSRCVCLAERALNRRNTEDDRSHRFPSRDQTFFHGQDRSSARRQRARGFQAAAAATAAPVVRPQPWPPDARLAWRRSHPVHVPLSGVTRLHLPSAALRTLPAALSAVAARIAGAPLRGLLPHGPLL